MGSGESARRASSRPTRPNAVHRRRQPRALTRVTRRATGTERNRAVPSRGARVASESRPVPLRDAGIPLLRVSDGLVGEDGDAMTDGVRGEQPQRLLVCSRAEEPLPGAEYDREDLQAQLVDEVVVDQRT